MLYTDFNMDNIDIQDIDFSHQQHPSKHIKLDSSASAGTRQKSCNACVRGKRRCDKKAPRCTRCAAKNLDCVYHKVPPGASGPSESSSAPSSVGIEEVPDLVPQMDLSGFEMESYTTTDTSPESMGHIDLQHGQHHNSGHIPIDPAFNVDLSFADIVGGTSASDDAMSFPCTMSFDAQILAQQQESEQHTLLEQPQLQPQHSPASRPSSRPVATAASDDSSSNTAQLPVARTKRIQDLTHYADDPDSMCINASEVHNPRSRIGITLAYLKTIHVTFAQKMQLCVMHPQLWRNRLPKSMMMTFSAASAYTNRNPENMGWTMQLLADTAKDVVREGMEATTKEDKLARLQALLLLFVMRMFDGDIASRAAAEKDMTTLLSWTTELLELLDQSEEGPRSTKSGLAREPPPKSWDSWIYFESARRTRGLVMCLLCVVMVLRDEPLPDREEDWCRQGFTASRSLWEARSPMEFNKVWKEQPSYLIRDFDFKEFWQYGRPDEVDEFTRIMFAAAVGQDAFNYFMQETPSVSVLC